ncbi:MAG: CorA family divalent cation transporter [Eubacterium sp.]
MLYVMEHGKITSIKENKEAWLKSKTYIGVYSYKEAESYAGYFGINERILHRVIQNASIRFESYDKMDFLCLDIIDIKEPEPDVPTMHIFIRENRFFIVCEDLFFVEKILKNISDYDEIEVTFGRLLFNFFDKLLENDNAYLEDLEEKIMILEKEVIGSKEKSDDVNTIIDCRKHLVLLKRYYEQISIIFKYIDLNENKILDHQSLKLLRILGGKVERLRGNVLSLIEYVAQIREAYQAEVDIKLNSTMKLFTVITTIFFPLSLIAAWYGMNFNMPEYKSVIGYPLVIILSAAVVVISIIYFKKNKWF